MTVVVANDSIQLRRLRLGPFETNAYILVCVVTGDSVLVDAPAEAGAIFNSLKDTSPKYILLTHNHVDHVGALSEVHSRLSVPLRVHILDAVNLPSKPGEMLEDGDTISFGRQKLEVLHTPGHTPGSLCFKVGDYLLSGDTIFPGGPGSTGSPADFRQIIQSITGKIFKLPDATQIFPGHGDATVVKREKEQYAVFASRPHGRSLCGHVQWLSA